MDENTINSLREALKFSPDNIPLRHHLAEILVQANRLPEAEAEYLELMKLAPDDKTKTGLATVYFKQEAYSKCNVILEAVIEGGNPSFDTLILYSRALLKEKSIGAAITAYQKALKINPN